jgi:hypothetical protein
LRVLVFWSRQVDCDMNHSQIGIAEAGIYLDVSMD